MKVVKLKNIEMPYVDFGKGKKNLIVLPGLSLKPVTPSEAFLINTFKDFTDDFRIYVFDRNQTPRKDYTMYQMYYDTYQVIQHLNIQHSSIYGTSQGAMLGLYFGVYAKEFVEKIALVSTSAKINQKSIDVVTTWQKLAIQGDIKGLLDNFLRKVYSENTLNQYYDVLFKSNLNASEKDIENFIINDGCFLTLNIFDKLKEITAPTFIIGTKGDLIFSFEQMQQIVDILHCDYYLFTKGSHAIYDENPEVLSRIYYFLTK